jgi:putative isomerase
VKRHGIGALLLAVGLHATAGAAASDTSPEYRAVQTRLQQGWNTWDTHTVTGSVLLPYGLSIAVGVHKRNAVYGEAYLKNALIGRRGDKEEQVVPGPHAWDGAYTELQLAWNGIAFTLQTVKAGDDLVMLVTPRRAAVPTAGAPAAGSGLVAATQPGDVVFSASLLWNRPGTVERGASAITARLPGKDIAIHPAGTVVDNPYFPAAGPSFAFRLDAPSGISTGKARTVAEIESIVAGARTAFLARTEGIDGKNNGGAVRGAIETVLGWDTVYEPGKGRVISPVSRIWNENWGGYVLFEWDTFFAATLAAVGNKDLAYANALEILNEAAPGGHVPNYARAGGWKSSDRSEPPVGAITILELYKRFGDRWFLAAAYDRLLAWNAWWPAHRDRQGYLVWGSDPTTPVVNPDDTTIGTLQGAKYESGLDNSPMYDGAGFDKTRWQMELADVGLMSLYVADCDALAEIAAVLGKAQDVAVLRGRADKYRRALGTLWDPATNIYRNKDLRTGALSPRLSPTNFYPLIARVPTAAQADAMIHDHLRNPDEFWHARVLPSIARNDPAFADQEYWRGRIWGPMNYLVWLGLGKYATPTAVRTRRELGQLSLNLFLEEWKAGGHVHENYSGTGPDNDSAVNSDRFYHWGALLGLIGPGVAQ